MTRRVLILLTIIAFLGLDAGLFLKHRSADASEGASREVIALAKTATPLVLSYEFSSLDAYRDQVQDVTTGEFRAELLELIDSRIRPTATKERITTKATVPEVAVVSASSERVVVLAFVNQVTHKKSYADPRVEGSRVRVTFVREGSDWMIAQLEPV
ncbi:MAG TPA: hypothetical protein VFK52_10305 [Nocardioidaceae bacterium]|nr:hypothetical protein [Nocardioidaceae bacterium]